MRNSAECDAPDVLDFQTVRPAADGFPELKINPQALERMRSRSIEGLVALRRRGMEIGGLLVGRVESSAEMTSTVFIQDFLCLEIAHECGPSYELSQNEIDAFRADIVAAGQKADDCERVVGWWRTDTRAGKLLPGTADETSMPQLFHDAPALCLLIRPDVVNPLQATMHLLESGQLRSSDTFELESSGQSKPKEGLPATQPREMSAMEPAGSPVELDSTMQGRGGNLDPAPQPEEVMETALDRKPLTGMAKSADRAQHRFGGSRQSSIGMGILGLPSRRRMATVVLAAYGFLVALLVLFYAASSGAPTRASVPGGNANATVQAQKTVSEDPELSTKPSQPPEPLSLYARRLNDSVQIRWDWKPDETVEVATGTLTIQDGNAETKVSLSDADIRLGVLTYFPRSDAMRVNAMFYGEGIQRQGALNLVGLGSPARDEEQVSPKPSRHVSQSSELSRRPVASRGESAATGWDTENSTMLRRQRTIETPAGERASAGTGGPSLGGAPGPMPQEPLHEALKPQPFGPNTTTPAQTEVASQREPAPLSQEKMVARCNVTVQTLSYMEPGSRFGFLRVLRKLPFVPGGDQPEATGEFVKPSLLRQRCPDLGSATLASQPREVNFMVKLDADGRVEKAEATGAAQSTPAGDLIGRSLKTWRFRPATVGSKAVSSEVWVTVALRYPSIAQSTDGQ